MNRPGKSLCLVTGLLMMFSCSLQAEVIWKIGEADNSVEQMALKPGGYGQFLREDFGWEDRFFLIGHSKSEEEWPHIFPGPRDTWGGTWATSGLRTHVLNILFELAGVKPSGDWTLVIDIFDTHRKAPPLLKVSVNGKPWKFRLPAGHDRHKAEKGTGKEHIISIPLPPGLIRTGGNHIQIGSLEGNWFIYDQVRLEGPGDAKLVPPRKAFLRDVTPADYELSANGKRVQPLLVDVEHVTDQPSLTVKLDNKTILEESLEKGRYTFEAPMPAVKSARQSRYVICLDGKEIASGTVNRTPEAVIGPADYVDTLMGTAHSRWMIAPGPWMPFSMVKLSPDNQNTGWQGGYQPTFENIAGFSHIHEWTMGGLLLQPCNGKLVIYPGKQDSPGNGYRSRIDKLTEKAGIGSYEVHLSDYDIDVAVTATTRCGFHHYTFNKGGISRVLVDLLPNTEYKIDSLGLEVKKAENNKLVGFSKQMSRGWPGSSQEYTVHFVVEFDRPIKNYGTWGHNNVFQNKDLPQGKYGRAGAYVEFDLKPEEIVQARVGISLVSIENAQLNLDEELIKPFGWDYKKIYQNQKQVWNSLLGRINIETTNRREKRRFYSNMYRSLCSRNTWSDVDGSWIDATEKLQKFKNPDSVALGCDAFWNTFWNLNQLWNLVTPEWSSRWVRSQLAMFDANGWLAKGPAGMEFVPVMVAEHEIPLIVGAYQMGIRDYDVEKAFQAVYKVQTTPGTSVGGGYAGNRDLVQYLKHKYVPCDKGRFSNSLEYSYDDWTVAQFARALKKEKEYQEFKARGNYWRNVIDKDTGYARMKHSNGNWQQRFDPYKSGANHHYVEGNAWQLTFFVPQNVPALAESIGKDRFIERLDWGFTESNKLRFNAPNDQYWDYPVIQGNQQSMHFAYLFNWVGRPWMTQRWARAVMDRYYGDGLANAYLGDEDQGQMSAWFVMSAIGLFQTDGGCRVNPIYEIGSPLYPKVVINLGERYGRGKTFTIEAKDVSQANKYIQSAQLNGKPLDNCWFPAADLLKGGSLVLQMGPKPNESWGKAPTAQE